MTNPLDEHWELNLMSDKSNVIMIERHHSEELALKSGQKWKMFNSKYEYKIEKKSL